MEKFNSKNQAGEGADEAETAPELDEEMMDSGNQVNNN